MTRFESTLVRFASIHLAVVAALSFLFRLFLVSMHPPDIRSLFFAFAVGPIFDIAAAVYSFLPFVLLLVLLPNALTRKVGTRRLLTALLSVDLFIFLFNLTSEYFFYDEFKDRFNFIAVDYLVYTHEVLENIWQSYPVISILLGFALIAAGGGFAFSRLIFTNVDMQKISRWEAPRALGAYAIVFGLCFTLLSESSFFAKANFLEELVGKNGLYALLVAYRTNEIKFDRFYTTMDGQVASEYVHVALEGQHHRPLPGNTEVQGSIVRNIREPKPFKRLNVVLVIMESLSARFMKSYGNTQGLTPNLDRLAAEGLFFDRIYATGTRTVRGLEAIVLSIPPTPGQSIVRRPAGIGISNIGTPFREQNYKTNFIYGGRALFDNMGAFFAGNGFEVFDQATFPADEILFSNAWGVADEDLFNQVVKISDASAARGEKFFHVVLNTSNHRPYTYPEGRVAISSGKGRDGAVQYSDYAIGKFLKDARAKSWYDDTIFIFVADHNASVAGRSLIDPNDYLVPMIMYGPKWIKPQVVHHMGSQIDLAPTLLEFLNASYQSRFFGMELQDDNPARAFIGTYQSVGYLNESSLTILAPNRKVQEFSWDGKAATLTNTSVMAGLSSNASPPLKATVSFYKAASDWFSHRLLEEKNRVSQDINSRD